MRENHPSQQRADVDGQGNVIVQILGNDNRVDLARPYLRLTRYLTRRRIESDADRLSPYTRSIPLVGRQEELASLRAWLNSGRPISVRVLTGRAGAGKTRLSLELCDELFTEGWAAGFAESGELTRFYDKQDLADWGWGRPTLMVVDYAAIHAERLNGWLSELADSQGHPDRPLRILLLERHADTSSGWWQTAFGRGGFGARSVQKLLDPPEAIELPALAATDERRAVIAEMLEQAESDQRPPAAGTDPAFDRQLAELTWGGEPLFLMMAGLMAKDAGIGKVLTLGRTDLAFELADRELKRIADIGRANGVDPDFLTVMAGHVTLCRGLATAAIRAAVPEEQTALGVPSAGDPGKVARLLADALPGAAGTADPILPDMIGEAALLRAFQAYDDDGSDACGRAFRRAGQQVATTVIRAGQDFAGAGYEQPLAWLDTLGRSVGVDQLMLIANELPQLSCSQSSLALAGHEVRIHGAIAENLAEEIDQGRTERMPSLAAAYNNLALSLSAVGQREAALRPAEEAVAIRRQLAAQAPDAYRPDLARALNNLAKSLREVGQHQAALATAQEAVAIRRELAAEAPDAYRPDLARALNTLAICLNAVGQREAALAPAQEAAGLYRELAAKAPDAYRPALAMALDSLATSLSEVGQRQEALGPAQEAVAIRRELAAKAPDAYRPDLAMALNNLGTNLSEVGQREEALGPAQEAAALYRELAAKAPDAYRPDLAAALSNMSTSMGEVGQREAALAPAQEAVAIRRELAAKAPHAYRPDLAMALNNLAIRWGEAGHREPALASAKEAADLFRALAAQTPEAYRPNLATSLSNLANRLSKVGNRQEALAASEEAVAIRRELAASAPDVYRPDLARELAVLANRLAENGQIEAALQRNREAIEIYAPFFLAQPNVFAHWMLPMCQQYVERCEKLGCAPDNELLGPIAEALQRMQEGSDGDDTEGGG